MASLLMSLQTSFANTHPEPLSYRLPEAWEWHLANSSESNVSSLRSFHGFFCCHRSCLVNLPQLRETDCRMDGRRGRIGYAGHRYRQ